MFAKRAWLLILFLSAGALILSAPPRAAGAEAKYVIKFATLAPEGSSWMKHMRSLNDRIREKSGGRLAFRIYAGGIAGDELDVLKKIRIGQIHSAAFTGVGLGEILPMVRVLDLPFLFKNDEEIDRVHERMRPFFAEHFREKGFELLGWAEVGNVHLFSKKPVRSIEDLAGLKVWTWSGDPIAKETFSVMGVNPIPLAVTDVLTGINTGMIDTVYAPPLGALALQWYRSMNYMSSFPFVHSTGALLISSKTFNKLPKELAALLVETFDGAMKDLTSDLRAQSREAVKTIEASGVTVLPEPSKEAKAEFATIHRKVAKALTGVIYPREVLEKVYAILERNP